jgi:hypothetical protein
VTYAPITDWAMKHGASLSGIGNWLSFLFSTLYDFTFGKDKLRGYWMSKDQSTPQLFTRINWDACGQAMRALLFGKKRWLVKHLSGWCATGRNMKRRKEWKHDKCPICFQPNETIGHIMSCPDIQARLQ